MARASRIIAVLTGRLPASAADLFEYLPDNALLFVDESHRRCRRLARWRAAPPAEDHARRIWLPPAELHRQPAAALNEWDAMRPQSTFVSATPGPWEMNETGGVFSEQVIRPTA